MQGRNKRYTRIHGIFHSVNISLRTDFVANNNVGRHTAYSLNNSARLIVKVKHITKSDVILQDTRGSARKFSPFVNQRNSLAVFGREYSCHIP